MSTHPSKHEGWVPLAGYAENGWATPRKSPAQAKLGRGTLGSKMGAIVRATRLW
jgi:hypothetical protein